MKKRSALLAFVETVEVTGGVFQFEDGTVAPAGDTDWLDLGQAYMDACEELKRTPIIEAFKEE